MHFSLFPILGLPDAGKGVSYRRLSVMLQMNVTGTCDMVVDLEYRTEDNIRLGLPIMGSVSP